MFCKNCGRYFKDACYTFDDPSAGGVSLTNGYYSYAECPYCGNEDIEESKECPICGDDMRSTDIICKSCNDDFKASMKEIKDEMKIDDDMWIELICEYYEDL